MVGRRQFLGSVAFAAGSLASGPASAANHASHAKEAKHARAVSRNEALRPPGEAQVFGAQELEDVLLGSSYLGTGGGGSLEEARALIAQDLAAGHVFRVLPVGALADDDRVACPYALASLAPAGAAMQARLDALGAARKEPVQTAFEALEKHIGRKFSAVVPGEIGPLSLAEGLSIAARLGVPALDADTVGRAVPQINQHSVKVAGIPLTPIGAATPFGDTMIIETLGDPSRAEDILRSIAVVSQLCGVADSPISGALAKRDGTLVTGSLTLARTIGRAVRLAKASGADPISAARAAGDGYALFKGKVADFSWRDEDGFLVGDLALAGTGAFTGQTFTTQFVNEHLVARRNGMVVATCPDLISVIDVQSYDGINNPDFTREQDVAVLGVRSDPLWRSEAGLAVFSPRYFGFDLDYVPIEELALR